MNLSTTRLHLAVIATAITVIALACGTDSGTGSASQPEHSWPPPEVKITREEAIEITLRDCTGSGPSMPALQNPSNPVATLMKFTEYDARTNQTTTGDYVNDWHWVVQLEGDSKINPPGATAAQLAGLPPFRYKACVLHATTGDIRASQASPSAPLLTPLELRRFNPAGGSDPRYGTVTLTSGSPTITRDQLIELIQDKHPEQHYLNRLEIELVVYTTPPPNNSPAATPTPGIEPPEKATARAERATARALVTPTVRPVERLAWLVTIPQVLVLQACSGPPQSKTIGCMSGITQQVIDSETGDTLNSEHAMLGLWFFTREQWSAANEFAQNYRKSAFTPEQWEENKEEAQAQGHWELWQRLKQYESTELPDNLVELLSYD